MAQTLVPSIWSASAPDEDPIPELLCRSERVPMKRTTLEPAFEGQMHEVNHLMTQVHSTTTLEHNNKEAPVLAKRFEKVLAQTCSLKQGIK